MIDLQAIPPHWGVPRIIHDMSPMALTRTQPQ